MRQVVLDTETTGLEPQHGHRIIEIGALELVDRQRTGKHYHTYLNPERDIEYGAMEVHGITAEFLADKPLFADIADDLLAFIEGAELVIHNAPFDIGFIEHELGLMQHDCSSVTAIASVLDTLELARDLHPGQRNNLDALCKRYEVDNSSRTLHGALLDAEILADVYLAMTGGQEDLGLSLESDGSETEEDLNELQTERPELLVLRASDEELALHEQRLADIQRQSGKCVYRELQGS